MEPRALIFALAATMFATACAHESATASTLPPPSVAATPMPTTPASVAEVPAPAPATADTSGGLRSIGRLLRLEVPAGFAVEDRSTAEEATLVIQRPAPTGELGARLTVCVTFHPPNIGMPVDRSGRYLGRAVSWRNLYGSGVERRSAVLRIPGHDEYAYSLAEARTLDEIAELIALASRIEVVAAP